jgi:hypothetical protein
MRQINGSRGRPLGNNEPMPLGSVVKEQVGLRQMPVWVDFNRGVKGRFSQLQREKWRPHVGWIHDFHAASV